MNKVWMTLGVLALGALGFALVLKSQVSTAKTVTLEPSTVVKSAKPNRGIKSAGSLEDLTKNAPEPRAVTTDAIVVPPKPAPTVSSVQEVVGAKSEVTTPVTASGQVIKAVPEITKPIEQPQVSSTIETPTGSPENLSKTPEKPVTTETNSSIPIASLPLRRSPGSVSIQAGAFKTAEYAESLRAQLTTQGFKASVELGEDGISRVMVGPYPNEQTARAAPHAQALAMGLMR